MCRRRRGGRGGDGGHRQQAKSLFHPSSYYSLYKVDELVESWEEIFRFSSVSKQCAFKVLKDFLGEKKTDL